MIEASSSSAAVLAVLDIEQAIVHCHLESFLCPPSSASSSSSSSSSLSSSSSSSFSSTLLACTPTTAPELLLSIIKKETEAFLPEIEKADLQLHLQKEAEKTKNRQLAGSNSDNLITNSSSNNSGSITCDSSGYNGRDTCMQDLFLDCISDVQIDTSVFATENCGDVNMAEIFTTENKKSGLESERENEINDKINNETNDINSRKEEVPEKGEKLPVAELILASHATLLLYSLCVSHCQDSFTLSLTENDENLQSNYKNNDSDDESGNYDGYKGGMKEVQKGIKEEREESIQREIKEFVRSSLPRGCWWLPIRVLKGFLVLQGEVCMYSIHIH